MARFVRLLAAARLALEEREAERRVLLEEDEQQYHTPDDSEHAIIVCSIRINIIGFVICVFIV